MKIVWSLSLLALLAIQVGAQPSVEGSWSEVFDWRNVGIHVSLLPNGKVLYWSRREGADMHEQFCIPRLWDPITKAFTDLPRPKTLNGEDYNLFCSGHTFLSDGRLIVAGGHKMDSRGLPHTSLFDYRTNTWAASALLPGPPFLAGRWYPTLLTMADGSVLVSGGSNEAGTTMVEQAVWTSGVWRTNQRHSEITLYPRYHLAPNGNAFLAGPLVTTQLLDTATNTWTVVGNRRSGRTEDYAPTVMFAPGKVLYIGGGDAPSAKCERIDLNATPPQWNDAKEMNVARRQHNATLLPDGRVLVTGGTQRGGFNDIASGGPVREAEMYDPLSNQWKTMAKEAVNRCYHAAAILLPDGRVLSTGGGEFIPDGQLGGNPAAETNKNAQIFSPPYALSSSRPVISAVPSEVDYGRPILITTADAARIARVTLVRLSSTTHSMNMNQRFNELTIASSNATSLTATAPANPTHCPPGHYLLSILDTAGVPSVSKIIRIK